MLRFEQVTKNSGATICAFQRGPRLGTLHSSGRTNNTSEVLFVCKPETVEGRQTKSVLASSKTWGAFQLT
jgi:hypothetical protein